MLYAALFAGRLRLLTALEAARMNMSSKLRAFVLGAALVDAGFVHCPGSIYTCLFTGWFGLLATPEAAIEETLPAFVAFFFTKPVVQTFAETGLCPPFAPCPLVCEA